MADINYDDFYNQIFDSIAEKYGISKEDLNQPIPLDENPISFATWAAKTRNDSFYVELDKECERILTEAKFQGEITRETIAAAGYSIAHKPDGSACICKDGRQVSKTITRFIP